MTVPGDITLVGYDDEEAAKLTEPPPYEELAALAVSLAIQARTRPLVVERQTIAATLRRRQSALLFDASAILTRQPQCGCNKIPQICSVPARSWPKFARQSSLAEKDSAIIILIVSCSGFAGAAQGGDVRSWGFKRLL
ncbi:hypothetical protein [Arthrobacter sp. ISL-28]|uniref:hypothetical protein n=1 Tax=Arthrobacter sp. ISL-28 TaxID=2819108 RepID=UPI0037BFDBC1